MLLPELINCHVDCWIWDGSCTWCPNEKNCSYAFWHNQAVKNLRHCLKNCHPKYLICFVSKKLKDEQGDFKGMMTPEGRCSGIMRVHDGATELCGLVVLRQEKGRNLFNTILEKILVGHRRLLQRHAIHSFWLIYRYVWFGKSKSLYGY